MSIDLNNERATGILMWWIEGTDGNIYPKEEEAVPDALSQMKYSMDKYQQEIKMFISGLSEEQLQEAVDESIKWDAEHFDERSKEKTLLLLNTISYSNKKEDCLSSGRFIHQERKYKRGK